MRLPHADRAVVDDAKVRDHLLADDHPRGRHKARFFGTLGFARADWHRLRETLCAHAREGTAEDAGNDLWGRRWLVRGIVRGTGGRIAPVVSAWMIRRGEDVPRLVTAYPDRSRR